MVRPAGAQGKAMDEAGTLRQQEEQAYAALNRLRDTVDVLPEDHPSTPLVVQAVATAEVHWRKLREAAERMEQAALRTRRRQDSAAT